MTDPIDYTKTVQYELMRGRKAVEAIKAYPVGYLPVGCLERHGDHLPMGLDVIKSHGICCIAAKAIGGVVFPPHYYSGIHGFSAKELEKFSGEWGNVYTDNTAKDSLIDVISQLAIVGVKALVLYTGHYPQCQVDMALEIAKRFEGSSIKVIPFWERKIMDGEHAGISETSFMLYLDRDLVDMTAIGEINYQDHGWRPENSPEIASAAKGERDVGLIVAHLRGEIERALEERDEYH